MRCYGEFFPPEEQDASKGDVLKHGPGFSDEVEQVKGETAAKNKIKKHKNQRKKKLKRMKILLN